jgi:hypothetical protein
VLATETGYDAICRAFGEVAFSPALLTPGPHPSRILKARCRKHRALSIDGGWVSLHVQKHRGIPVKNTGIPGSQQRRRPAPQLFVNLVLRHV